MANGVDLDITADHTRNSCINTRFSPFVPPVDFHRHADGVSSNIAVGSDSKKQ
jgi:hypothetical protein